jgi:hypothetical protein
MYKVLRTLAVVGAAMVVCSPAAAQSMRTIAGASCNNPPRINCPEANCLPALSGDQGPAIEPKTGRKFFLDFPCDLKPGEKVIFILSLHGAGSIGNWQRHYFPAVDLKEKYRLVVATPTAATATPQRRWVAEADDSYLQNISDLVIKEFGAKNIKSFWLAGHSQGGITSRRIVCSAYFRDKVDGWLSLSGGRLGSTQATFGRAATPAPAGAPAAPGRAAAPPAAAPAAPAALPDCDFSFIYDSGQLEIDSLPATSPWAQKYGCGARVKHDVVDTKPGYVTATDQSRGPSWGRFARPGTAQVYDYPGCRDGRVVADFLRLDKGHTEGLEPNVLDEILKRMVSARGGKLQR